MHEASRLCLHRDSVRSVAHRPASRLARDHAPIVTSTLLTVSAPHSACLSQCLSLAVHAPGVESRPRSTATCALPPARCHLSAAHCAPPTASGLHAQTSQPFVSTHSTRSIPFPWPESFRNHSMHRCSHSKNPQHGPVLVILTSRMIRGQIPRHMSDVPSPACPIENGCPHVHRESSERSWENEARCFLYVEMGNQTRYDRSRCVNSQAVPPVFHQASAVGHRTQRCLYG